MENIKQACMGHFEIDEGYQCVVLVGEGPSYTDVNQIWNWKLIHIRFVENKLIPRDRRRSKTRENEHSNATSMTSRATEDTNEKRNLSLPMPSYSGVTGVTP